MIDEDAATELRLYIDNDGDLYERQTTGILRNLATKAARGEYDHDLAVKAFGYLVESGAKKYVKEHGGGPWHRLFSVPTRRVVAEDLTRRFETDQGQGGHEYLLPKKHRLPKELTTAQLDRDLDEIIKRSRRRR